MDCPDCDGVGYVDDGEGDEVECGRCAGDGWILDDEADDEDDEDDEDSDA
jgi:DnaJ-class molecular chaperone